MNSTITIHRAEAKLGQPDILVDFECGRCGSHECVGWSFEFVDEGAYRESLCASCALSESA